jgi:hypothetical protein
LRVKTLFETVYISFVSIAAMEGQGKHDVFVNHAQIAGSVPLKVETELPKLMLAIGVCGRR